MNAPTIAVIIPSVPGRRFLTGSLLSIADAGIGPDDQVVVGFDGNVCCGDARAFAASVAFVDWPTDPGRLIWSVVIREGPSNDWGAKARTLAATVVKTDWVVYLDDDDALAPDAFAIWRTALAVVGPDDWRPRHFRAVVNDGSIVHGRQEVAVGNVSTLGIAVRREVAQAIPWPATRYEHDFDFLAAAAAAHGGAVFVDSEPVAIARAAGTRAGKGAFVRALVLALDEGIRPDLPGATRRIMERDRLVYEAADLLHVERPAMIAPDLFPDAIWGAWPTGAPVWPDGVVPDRPPKADQAAPDAPGSKELSPSV